MKIMPCPLNGPRNIQEFICAGPVEPHPDPNRCTDHEWTEFVWMEENLAGVVREWWCHVATSYWFIAERNTVTDEILATYPADRVFSERVEFEPLAPPPETEAKPKPPKEPVPPTPPQETPPPTAEDAPAEVAQEAPSEEPAAPEPEPQAEPAEATPETPEAPEAPEDTAPADTAAEGDAPADQASADDTPADNTPADDTPPRESKDPAP